MRRVVSAALSPRRAEQTALRCENEKIAPAWNTIVEEVLADEEGLARGLRVRNRQTDETSEIPCKGVFVAIGHVPNTKPFEGVLDLDENGYLVPQDEGGVRTSIPGVYVAGDCADHVYRQAITAAGMGCQAAIECERWLAEQG